MTINDRYLIEPLTYYSAGIAYADWLSGNTPRAIYRLDKGPASTGQTIVNRVKRLAILGTKSRQNDLARAVSRSEMRKAKAFALSQSCVALGGLAGLNGLEKVHKEAVHATFHLAVEAMNRAATLLAAVATSEEMGTTLAFDVLNQLEQRFHEPVLKRGIEILAVNLQRRGIIEGDDLEEYLMGSEEFRVFLPDTIIDWPSIRGNYISLHGGEVPVRGEASSG